MELKLILGISSKKKKFHTILDTTTVKRSKFDKIKQIGDCERAIWFAIYRLTWCSKFHIHTESMIHWQWNRAKNRSAYLVYKIFTMQIENADMERPFNQR